MTLTAYITAHLFPGGLLHIDAAPLHGLDKRRIDHPEIHRRRVMAIGANDGMLHQGI